MKKLVTGMLAFVLITGAANAQKAQRGKEHRSHDMEQLNLTADQKAKMQALRASHKQEWEQWKQNNNPSDEVAKARKKEMMQLHRAQMKEILTPEQRQKMEQLRAQRGDRSAARTHQGRGKSAMQHLNLTDAQQAKIRSLNQDFRTKRQGLHNNTALTETQKEAQMKALAQQHRQNMKSVLTPEQQQKIEGMRKDFRSRNGK